ncbi:hypothetical protein SAY87_011266 [Trapa incisa]|uniref:Xyloglucan endotransglucosylase/hydrolase n=1 Tax=Trapa incisa TaxID=236973 RepID=A0AAN7JI71_9MYRT|nr:hypothetical protein SAY87_011266 [Trapa incisa]
MRMEDKLTRLIALFGLLMNLLLAASSALVSSGDYDRDFFVMWSPSHVNTSSDGRMRSLILDRDSGAGFASNDMFLFGKMDMQIKLIPGYSAGTVVAFYLTSDQPNRDEVDFEFLGNVVGQSYILQTNIYSDGFDNREERIHLWFDPTRDFHNYSILWNINQIVFFVDSIPIRTFRNHADKGVAFPRWQPMSIKATLWNGDSWATRGGKDKVDWSKGPFAASFGNYTIDACTWRGNPRFCRSESSGNWWNGRDYSSLTRVQKRWFKWVRINHMIYDYCQDNQRFQGNLPLECSLSKY